MATITKHREMSLYVIKTIEGAFVSQNSLNSKELNYTFTSIESAEKYTKSSLDVLKERFKGTWREKGFKVYEVVMSLKSVNYPINK